MQSVKYCKFLDIAKDIHYFALVHEILVLITYVQRFLNDALSDILSLEVIKLFPCSTQLSMKFQLLIKAKILKNEEVSCFKYLRCCIYHANKC